MEESPAADDNVNRTLERLMPWMSPYSTSHRSTSGFDINNPDYLEDDLRSGSL